MTKKINDLSTGTAADAMQLETDIGGTTANKLALSALATYVLGKGAAVATSGSASDLTTGTLAAAQLPNPSASTLGGVQSAAAQSHKFLTSISTSGVPSLAQPAASDISGLATSATTDTTSASNISSGTLAQARLPAMLSTSGVFASKPGSPSTGQMYFATDLGTGGVWITYTGSKWKPMGGIAVLVCDPTSNTASGTGSEQNITTITVPAGLLSANGALRLYGQMKATGTNGTKTMTVRFSATSGGTNGSQIMSNTFGGSASSISGSFMRVVQNNNATNSQVMLPTALGTTGSESGSAINTTSIDTTAATYFNINITGNASDTIGYQGLILEWLEP